MAREGQLEAWQDAAEHVDLKWERAFAKAERVREGVRRLLGDPARRDRARAEHARARAPVPLGAAAARAAAARHDRRRVPHASPPARPAGRGGARGRPAARSAGRTRSRSGWRPRLTAHERRARLGRAVRRLAHRARARRRSAAACADAGAELLVDAYHALGCLPFRVAGLERAWIVGGGYKYLQLGEGNCFLRLPPHADELRPAITGWFAEFEEMHAAARAGRDAVPDAAACASPGSTYDPTSHYRAARVFDFFDEQGLTPERLRESYLHQTTLLARALRRARPPDERSRATARRRSSAFGGFLALESPSAQRS